MALGALAPFLEGVKWSGEATAGDAGRLGSRCRRGAATNGSEGTVLKGMEKMQGHSRYRRQRRASRRLYTDNDVDKAIVKRKYTKRLTY